jgi:hypothetical protein
MQSARETRTDERLDELSARVDRGFHRVDQDVRELRADLKSGHEALRTEIKAGSEALREEMNVRLGEISMQFDTRFGRLERTIWSILVAFVAAFLAGKL